MIQQWNKLLRFQRWWAPPFSLSLLDRCFGPPELPLPVSTGCTRQLRDLVTPISSLRWTSSPLQGKKIATFECQSNSIQLQGWGVLATLQPPSEFGQDQHPWGYPQRQNWTRDQGDKAKCSQPSSGTFRGKNRDLAFRGYPGERGVPEAPLTCSAQAGTARFLESFPRSCCPWQPARGASTRCVPRATRGPLRVEHRGNYTLYLSTFWATNFTVSHLSYELSAVKSWVLMN